MLHYVIIIDIIKKLSLETCLGENILTPSPQNCYCEAPIYNDQLIVTLPIHSSVTRNIKHTICWSERFSRHTLYFLHSIKSFLWLFLIHLAGLKKLSQLTGIGKVNIRLLLSSLLGQFTLMIFINRFPCQINPYALPLSKLHGNYLLSPRVPFGLLMSYKEE